MPKKAECVQIEPLFDKYLDGDITVQEYRLLRTHLSQCPPCHDDWHNLERAIRQVENLSEHKPSDEFMPKLLTRLPSQRRFPKQWRLWVAGVAAAGLFIAVVGLSSMSDGYMAMMTLPGPGGSRTVPTQRVTVLPDDTVLQGDLTVVNGDVYVAGRVEGNVSAVGGRVSSVDGLKVEKAPLLQRIGQYLQRVGQGIVHFWSAVF